MPLSVTIIILVAAGICAAIFSPWFAQGLQPTIYFLSVNDNFAGLVIVAIAGNATGNVIEIIPA